MPLRKQSKVTVIAMPKPKRTKKNKKLDGWGDLIPDTKERAENNPHEPVVVIDKLKTVSEDGCDK